tara:strand:- start:3392 stop:3559 length:168 start_codon:yes stop_codon:yes gene_type:complete
MKVFIYYRREDKLKEPIGHVEANNIHNATSKASTQKQLSHYEFNKLFKLEEKKKR